MRGKIIKDPELTAMSKIQTILQSLTFAAQRRVIQYVYERVHIPENLFVTKVDHDTKQMTLDDVQPRELRCESEHGTLPPANS